MMGIFRYHEIAFPQCKQRERGEITDIPLGKRSTHTHRKLPMQHPKMTTIKY